MTTFTSTRAAANFPVASHGLAGDLKVATGTIQVAANPADGDIYEMVKLPRGAVVVGGHLQGADIDTGTETLDLDIGWASNGVDAADPDGFGNLGVATGDAIAGLKPEVGIYFPLGGVLFSTGPKKFGAETKIQLEANAAAAVFAAGQLTLTVFYFVNDGYTNA